MTRKKYVKTKDDLLYVLSQGGTFVQYDTDNVKEIEAVDDLVSQSLATATAWLPSREGTATRYRNVNKRET